MKEIRKYFIEGLLFILPLTLTVYIIYIVFRWVYKLFDFAVIFIPEFYRDGFWIKLAVTLATILLMLLLIILMGVFVKTVLGRTIDRIAGRFFAIFPGMRTFYSSMKQLLALLFQSGPNRKFSRVVMVEFPDKGRWAIAFLTGKCPARMAPDGKTEYYTVFLPTSPNPASGFLIFLPKRRIRETRLSFDEAMKLILSGGIVKE